MEIEKTGDIAQNGTDDVRDHAESPEEVIEITEEVVDENGLEDCGAGCGADHRPTSCGCGNG